MTRLEMLQDLTARRLAAHRPFSAFLAAVDATPTGLQQRGKQHLYPAVLTVLAPAFLVDSYQPTPPAILGQALLSVQVVVLDDAQTAAAGFASPAAMAETVLLLLDGFEHGLAHPGILRAERQAIAPGPAEQAPMEYIMRYSSGGAEKFRRTPLKPPRNALQTPWFVHFKTELHLPRL